MVRALNHAHQVRERLRLVPRRPNANLVTPDIKITLRRMNLGREGLGSPRVQLGVGIDGVHLRLLSNVAEKIPLIDLLGIGRKRGPRKRSREHRKRMTEPEPRGDDGMTIFTDRTPTLALSVDGEERRYSTLPIR